MNAYLEKVMKEYSAKAVQEYRRDVALKLLEDGKMTPEEIADCCTLPIEEVMTLANKP